MAIEAAVISAVAVTEGLSTDPGERTRTPSYGERAIAEAQLICFDNPRPGRP